MESPLEPFVFPAAYEVVREKIFAIDNLTKIEKILVNSPIKWVLATLGGKAIWQGP